MIALALAGVYLTVTMTQMELTSCSGCGKVLRHASARPFGFPLSLVGAGFYALVLLACLFPRPPISALVGLIGSALVLSIGLTVYAAIGLGTYCGWCLASLFLILALTVVSIIWRRRTAGAPSKNVLHGTKGTAWLRAVDPPLFVIGGSPRRRFAASAIGLALALLAFFRIGMMYQARASNASPPSHTGVSTTAAPARDLLGAVSK